MKISYSWLKEFIDTDRPAEQISEILTDIGLEVEKTEEVETVPGGLKGLVIGHVLTKEKHPDADRLNITTVDLGLESPQQIVCGAPNVDVGQKVVVASPGVTIYPTSGEPFKIKKAKIRGVESLGMICAEDEIGVGTDHDGIMVLEEDAKVGTEAATYFNLESDIIFEIGLTPNRADGMSHFGVARDLLVALKYRNLIDESAELKTANVDGIQTQHTNLPTNISVESDKCVRYAGLTISGVEVKESPDWLKNKLRTIGLSPINNIVDATNYVLHEYGQPLHAFDADIVQGNVVVKMASEGEKFTTLDDVERTLNENDLMICNATDAMCIAGVFGGSKSGVSNATTSIFLESAYFDTVSVRKTAKRHGLNTDASFRFERGIDPNITVYGLKRAAQVILEVAGGEISSEITDLYPTAIENFRFDVNMKRISQLCGIEFTLEQFESILGLLEIKVLNNNEGVLSLEVPAYRVDVQREADIAEEVLRIHGFNNVPIPEKLNSSLSYKPSIDVEKLQNLVSDWLCGKGMVEAMSNSLTSSSYISSSGSEKLKEEHNVAMLNPLSSDLDVLRQSLVFGILESVRLNQNHGRENIKLFEFGKTYHKYESGYSENKQLIIALSGKRADEQWNSDSSNYNFFSIKGLTEGVFKKLGLWKGYNVNAAKSDLLEDGLSISITKKNVAEIGWANAKLKKHFGLRNDVYLAILNWDNILEISALNKIKFKELDKFPAVKRDLSLLIDNTTKFEEIEALARKADRSILKEISLFDVYTGKNLEAGKKSYAVRFILQDSNKTLKDKEIEKVMGKIEHLLTDKLGASLR